jgi:hypothetical protein
MRKIILFVSFMCLVESAFGQNLDRLQDRAKRFLSLRAASNKAEAVAYVELNKRNDYLNRTPPLMSNPQVLALEFTNDQKVVYVSYKATFMIPEVGSFTTTVREPWIWNGKDWFLTFEEIGSPLSSGTRPPIEPPKPVRFDLPVTQLDFGKHLQGELIKQTIQFSADRDDVRLFDLEGDSAPGLSINPVWDSKQGGSIEVMIDTTLLNKDVDYTLELQAVGWESQRTSRPIHLKAEIESRLRFSQVPEVIDPLKDGTVELHVENLSNIPLKIDSMMSGNPAFRVANDLYPSADPGKTLTIVVKYLAQTEPLGAAVFLRSTEPVLGGRYFSIPLKMKLPVPAEPTYSKEQLEKFSNSQQRPQ